MWLPLSARYVCTVDLAVLVVLDQSVTAPFTTDKSSIPAYVKYRTTSRLLCCVLSWPESVRAIGFAH